MTLQEKDDTKLIEAMDPWRFDNYTKNNHRSPNKFRHGSMNHGSNVEYEFEIRLRTTDERGEEINLEHVLHEYLPTAHWAVTQNGHSFCIVRQEGGKKEEVGRDGIFQPSEEINTCCHGVKLGINDRFKEAILTVRTTYKGFAGILSKQT